MFDLIMEVNFRRPDVVALVRAMENPHVRFLRRHLRCRPSRGSMTTLA